MNAHQRRIARRSTYRIKGQVNTALYPPALFGKSHWVQTGNEYRVPPVLTQSEAVVPKDFKDGYREHRKSLMDEDIRQVREHKIGVDRELAGHGIAIYPNRSNQVCIWIDGKRSSRAALYALLDQ